MAVTPADVPTVPCSFASPTRTRSTAWSCAGVPSSFHRQCAAVTTSRGVTTVPPQNWLCQTDWSPCT